MKFTITLLLGVLCLSLLAPPASADGMIILHRPRPEIRPIPLAVKYHHVTVTIKDQIATTIVDQVFINPNNQRLEGTYIFPLNEGAVLSRMAMWIDGQEVEGEVLPRDEANKIYTDIVRRMKDPAILEYMGTRMFRMRIFPIEPRSEKRVKIRYTETVGIDAGLCTYRYPLSTEKFSSRPLDEVVISVDLASTIPLKTIFSPTHEVDVVKKSDHAAVVGFEKRQVTPNKDFILYYSFSPDELGASLVAHRRSGEDGYFSLFLTPSQEIDVGAVVHKDVVFVIDTSGSMKEPARRPWKIEQAQDALRFCVKSLNEGDRFNIVSFATGTRSFRENLLPATFPAIEEAMDFIQAMKAGGGTNIQAALEAALALQEKASSRPFMIVFLTDGLPTVGQIQGVGDLVELVSKRSEPQTRLFAFGVGYDVNTHLLDKLALQNRGERMYVAPEESIEVKVAGFYEKIACPVLSDVKVVLDGAGSYDLYPPWLPDLFKGSQLVLYGRYRGEGSHAIRVQGQVNGKQVERVYEASFPAIMKDNSSIPRLWATTKIGFLLDQLRLKGIDVAHGRRPSVADKEIVDEIVSLSTRFGIVTPYTALLVMEDEKAGPGGPATPLARRLGVDNESAPKAEALRRAADGLGAATGRRAVESSKEMKRLRQGFFEAESTDLGRALDVEQTIRQIEDKTFIRIGDIWYDSIFEKGTATKKVVFLSDEYFRLLADTPEIGRYLSVASRIVVCVDGKVFEIVMS